MDLKGRRQLPMHLNKWIVTVREGKDLTRGDQRGSFFSKMNPVCEVSVGGQGPLCTSVKPNTSQPEWNDSLEFDAGPLFSRPSKPGPSHSSENSGGSGDGDGDLLTGPKLVVVCYSRSLKALEGSSGGRTASAAVSEKVEIGRAEATLNANEDGIAAHSSSNCNSNNNRHNRLRIPLMRRNARGSQVTAGTIIVEYMFVLGMPTGAVAPPKGRTEQGCDECVSGKGEGRSRASSASRPEERPYRKPMILAAVGAMIVAVLAVRLAGVDLSVLPPDLTPIPVPFKIAAGKHKGSSTHHIRLQEDGNVVVAMGSKPLRLPAGHATEQNTILWQSGPLRSSERSSEPSRGRSSLSSSAGGEVSCKKCQLRVDKDGNVVVVGGGRGSKEELAVFTPSRVKKLRKILRIVE